MAWSCLRFWEENGRYKECWIRRPGFLLRKIDIRRRFVRLFSNGMDGFMIIISSYATRIPPTLSCMIIKYTPFWQWKSTPECSVSCWSAHKTHREDDKFTAPRLYHYLLQRNCIFMSIEGSTWKIYLDSWFYSISCTFQMEHNRRTFSAQCHDDTAMAESFEQE